MKKFLISLINFYQRFLSLDQGLLGGLFGGGQVVCRYHPTCSQYMKEVIMKHGVTKGVFLGGKRILRCTPWSEHPIHDPIP